MAPHRFTPESTSQDMEWPSLARRSATQGLGKFLRFLLLGSLAVSVALVFFFVDRQQLLDIATWLDSHRTGSGMAIFCSLCMLGVIFVIPGPVLAIISGALYGKVLGTILVWTSCSVGQSLTYFLGRFLLRDWVVDFASKYVSRFQTIDTALGKEGWKLVLLLRLSPLIPDSLLNYVLSVTSINYSCYAWSSSLAILPWSIAFAYIGSMAHNVAEAAGGEMHMGYKTMVSWSIVSFAFLFVLAWYAAKISRKALAGALDDKTDPEA